MRHPNIVRLYEVIESDRYIGIVLEYASGGELFDHILAHKYLKERDACRLFAQLISGVSYLHQKKIVHRDLKLENLLLDRNRNVIITDFGFANNFESKRDDLMATSCGSPCYAAPELVVQDGLYAGSAVDVWSCGVILYAMLAGYLPFDDDPANPDGDNINLLYKYIMATPLSFPDYITAEPRDLLCKMLVPDPMKRADLNQVMNHPWLSPYRDLFKFSVEELERAAIEQQNKKRQVYRQQMLLQQQIQEQQRTGRGNVAAGPGQTSAKQQKHRSAMAASSTVPDRIHEPSVRSPHKTNPNETTFPKSPENHHHSREGSQSSNMGRGYSNDGSSTKKSAGSKTQRHTVQLEYDSGTTQRNRPRGNANVSEAPAVTTSKSLNENENFGDTNPESKTSIAASPSDRDGHSPADPSKRSGTPLAVTDINSVQGGTRRMSHDVGGAVGAIAAGTAAATAATSSATHQRRQSNTSRVLSNPLPSDQSKEIFPKGNGDRVVSGGAGPRPDAASRVNGAQRESRTLSITSNEDSSMTPQRKGVPTDKSFLSKLLHTPSNASEATEPSLDSNYARHTGAEQDSPSSGRKSSGNRRKAMSLVVSRANDVSDKEREKAAKGERRLTARLRKDTLAKEASQQTPKRSVSTSTSRPSPASVATTTSTQAARSPSKQGKSTHLSPYDQAFNESSSTVGPSSNAAKKVMDWFRKRSLNRSAIDDRPPLEPFAVHGNAQTVAPNRSEARQDVNTPQISVDKAPSPSPNHHATGNAALGGLDSVPSSRSTSGTHSEESQNTHSTGITAATEDISTSPPTGPEPKSTTSPSQQATPRASATTVQREVPTATDDSALRVHQGAVDQSALTSKKPTDVFRQVQRALWDMGIEMRRETGDEYKLECVRRKRAKTLMGATQGLGLSLRTSVFPPTQADYERSTAAGARSPGSPMSIPASPSAAGSIRSFLRRRNSQQNALSSSTSSSEQQPLPLYGEPAVDGGQEVRFSVEVTRIKNLPGLYSVDIRRMKGNLWAYKFIYHALLERCQLAVP